MTMLKELKATQRVRILDLIGEGQMAGLCDASGNILSYEDRDKGILLDLTPIKNADGTVAASGVKTDFRLGAASQAPFSGFPSAEQEVIVSQQVTAAASVLREIPAGSHNAVRVNISLPALFQYSSSGARSGSQILFKVEIKRTADTEWKDATANEDGVGYDGIQGETQYPYVHSYRCKLEGAGPWQIRISRTTPETTDPTKLQNELWWQSYTLISDYRVSHRHSAIAAIEMEAKANQSIRPRAYRVKGIMCRVPSNYNPATRCYSGVWDGEWAGCDLTLTVNYAAGLTVIAVAPLACDVPSNSQIRLESGGKVYEAYTDGPAYVGGETLNITPIHATLLAGTTGRAYVRKWTNNPAWIWFDLATHKRYGVGQYIAEENIDIWALYSIARYCDGVDGSGNFVGVPDGKGGYEPRFPCSAYIGNANDAYKVLNDIASAFRGMIYWGSGLVIPVQDCPKAVDFNLTNAHVIDGRFEYSGSARKSRHTMANVRWNDPDDYYKPKLEQVPGDPEDMDRLGTRETTVAAFGCTSRGQARRVGKWLLLTEKHESETVTFVGGLEMARARPGAILRIRDRDKTVNRMGGRVKAIGAGTIELDAPSVIGADYRLLVTKDDGTATDFTVVNAPGTHQTITVFGGTLDGISPNNGWILHSPSLEPTLWRVLNVKELERHRFEVSALKYYAGKFSEVETGIVIDDPQTSDLPPVVVPNDVATVTVTETFVRAAEKMERHLNISWTAATGQNIRGYKVDLRAPGREWETIVAETSALSIPSQTVTVLGTYAVRVTTIGYYSLSSTGKEVEYSLLEVDPPEAVTGFAVVGVPGGFKATWTDALKDRGYYRLYVSTSTTRPTDPETTVPGGVAEWNYQGFTAAVTRYFWIEPVLYRIELPGDIAGPANATSLDPSAKLVVLTSDAQTFQIAKSGTVSPASITFTATGQNVSGSPVFTVVSGTATLTGTGSTRALAYTDMASDAVTVKVAWDGREDYVSVVKVREGSDAIVAFLTNESHTVPASSAGVVSDWSGASTVMKVYRGATDDTSNWTIGKSESFLTGTLVGDTYTASAIAADVGYCDLTATRTGFSSVTKRFTVTKSKAGAAGAAGTQGIPGPGLVYVGAYVAGTVYYCTTSRVDVVSYGGSYYRTNNTLKSGLTTWGTPGGGDWSAADATYKFVATDLLLAQNQTILKTLVMGDGSTTDAGIIRSAGATAYGTGTGYWFNPRNSSNATEFRVGNPSGSNLAFDGSNLTMSLGGTGTKLIVDIDPTFIGPNPPARLRFGTMSTYVNSSGTASFELSDGTMAVTQGNGFKIGNFTSFGTWYGVQTQSGGEARFPGVVKAAGDIHVPGAVGSAGGIKFNNGTTNAFALVWDGTNVRVLVDGSYQGTIPNP